MKCSYCGQDNPPGTRLCTNCRFILREVDPSEFNRGNEKSLYSRKPASVGPGVRGKGKSPLVKLIVVIVVVIVIVSIFALSRMYSSDPSMRALLYCSYASPTSTSEGSVRVWGDVHNLGSGDVEAQLVVYISDDFGHSASYKAEIGFVRMSGSVDVDERFPWTHPCLSIYDLDVEYDIRTRSAGFL